MHLRDLNASERRVLFWFLGNLTQIDGRIDPAEVAELRYLGSTLEVDLSDALPRAAAAFADRDEALAEARFVRPEAREVVREVLRDLAMGDGDVASEEVALLQALEAVWDA